MSLTFLTEAFFNGVSVSSILILTALGLAITFGVMKVINMAHGEMLMLGAYTAYILEDKDALPVLVRNLSSLTNRFLGTSFHWNLEEGFQSSLFVSIPASFLVVSLVGYLLEVCLIRFLYGRPLDTLLATWGVSLILQQLVLLGFGASVKQLATPGVVDHPIAVWGEPSDPDRLVIPGFRLFTIAITAVCLLALYLWFYRTSFGLKIRAVVQNRSMASAMGISTRWVDSLSFAFACGLAGVGGCIFAHLFNAKYDMGPGYVVDAFMVVILGGMGQLSGCVLGGVAMGFTNSFLAKFLGTDYITKMMATVGMQEIFKTNPDIMAKMLTLFAIIGFLLIRPSGFFTVKERSYE